MPDNIDSNRPPHSAFIGKNSAAKKSDGPPSSASLSQFKKFQPPNASNNPEKPAITSGEAANKPVTPQAPYKSSGRITRQFTNPGQPDLTQMETARVPGAALPPINQEGPPAISQSNTNMGNPPPSPSNASWAGMPLVNASMSNPPPSSPPNGQQGLPAGGSLVPRPLKKKGLRSRYNQLSKRGKIVLIVALICLLFPLTTTVIEGINAYVIYSQARSGLQHLVNVQHIFTGDKGHAAGYLDVNKLKQAKGEITAAHHEFQQLRDELDQDGLISVLGAMLPEQIATARALSHIGVAATEMGQELTDSAQLLAPTFRDPLLATSTKPLVTPEVMKLVQKNIDFMLPRLREIDKQSHGITLDSLPVSDKQRQQLKLVLQVVPPALASLEQGSHLLDAIGWLVGVDAPRNFLVQTMDRGELRATGGFTGQFGELKLNGGRMDKFELKNIGVYEYNELAPLIANQEPPAPYNSWWPVGNWGLRDSNVSADFPTSARISSDAYKHEFNNSVDGVILFSPFLISRVLEITGPVTVPLYNETITSQNLEAKLHFYQLATGDDGGIRKEKEIEHVSDDNEARKLFTRRLSNLLMDHVRHAPPDELINLAGQMLKALKNKDLQVYASNKQIEALIGQYGSTSSIDRSTTHDGLFIVHSNLGANKAAQYVRTQVQDTVTLDAAGGATHIMNMRFVYTQIQSVYGPDTYRDYMRIYVPPTSKLLWGKGFDQGFNVPLCGGSYAACHDDTYKDGSLLCPPGQTSAGVAPPLSDQPYDHNAIQPIDKTGPPANMASDEPGRNMYASWVVVPKNCNRTLALSWYVPPMGQAPYSLVIQRQSSTFPIVDLTILPTPGDCGTLKTPGLHFNGVLGTQDKTFALPTASPGNGKASTTRCYQQPGV